MNFYCIVWVQYLANYSSSCFYINSSEFWRRISYTWVFYNTSVVSFYDMLYVATRFKLGWTSVSSKEIAVLDLDAGKSYWSQYKGYVDCWVTILILYIINSTFLNRKVSILLYYCLPTLCKKCVEYGAQSLCLHCSPLHWRYVRD